ncbi:hypothetical protein HYX04_00080 [Candidatus Woesearchaeota archaeon]|nr:hypothetical protein [Candidatus Woesearchaeota archaeon]
MKLDKLITKKGLLFLLVFSILVFVGDRINFSKLIGADNQFFTLFQFFGPVAGAFLGPVAGVLSVLIAQVASKIVQGNFNVLYDGIVNFFISGNFKFLLDVELLRLTPMLFAAWYFGTKKGKLSFFVPVAAIILFVAHPVGRQAWFFSLFWTIPIIIKLLPKKYGDRVFLRSLGATFTAHAVGGAMWNYIVPMTKAAWIALIPVVIYERLLFAGGIAVSFVILNTLLNKLDSKTKAEYVNVDKRYVLFKHTA